MDIDGRAQWTLDRLRSNLTAAAVSAAVLVGVGAFLTWLANEQTGDAPKPEPALTTNIWFNLGLAAFVLAALVAAGLVALIFFPSRSERVDRKLQQEAMNLGTEIQEWLKPRLQPWQRGTDVQAFNHQRGLIGLEFQDHFGQTVHDFEQELVREQITHQRFHAEPNAGSAPALARDLLAFSELTRPLPRRN